MGDDAIDVGNTEEDIGVDTVRDTASRNTRSSASAVCGQISECLSSTVFPAISCGPATRTTWYKGKFHGSMASSTPNGAFTTTASPSLTGSTSGSKNPGPQSAKYCRMSAAQRTSP